MNIVRRMVHGLLAAALIVGFARPAAAAEPLTKVFDDTNLVKARFISTDIGEVNPITGETTFVSAVRTSNDRLRVHAYYLDAADTLISADADNNGPIKDIGGLDVARVGENGLVVVAVHLTTDQMKLIAFDVSTGPTGREITRLGESAPIYTLAQGEGAFINIVGVGNLANRQFVTTARTTDNILHLDSWVVSADGTTFTRRSGTTLPGAKFAFGTGLDVEIVGNANRKNPTFVTAYETVDNKLRFGAWLLGLDGTMTQTGQNIQDSMNHLDLAFDTTTLYVASAPDSQTAGVERWIVSGGIAPLGIAEAVVVPVGTLVNDLEVAALADQTIVVTVKNSLSDWQHHVMQDTGPDIVPEFVLNMSDDSFFGAGVSFENLLFFAITHDPDATLSHELWKN
jgi:hypothetical protein